MADLTYCPVCGHTLVWREEGGRSRQACDNCGYVHYVNPVPAVGIVIEQDGGIVLIRRLHPPHKGEWTLPSGFVEADESAEEAAVREAEEETGLKVEITALASVNSFPEGPPVSGIIIFFYAKPVGGELRAGDDAVEAKLFQPDELPRLPFRTHRETIALWLDQRQHPRATSEQRLTRPDFFIRPADWSDWDEIRALLELIPANRALTRGDMREIGQRFRESTTLEVFVAQSRQEPPILFGFIALSVVRTLTEGAGFISDMAVLPTYQRRGVGAALLEAVMRRADRLNLRYLLVNSERASDRAKAFYASLGFAEENLLLLRLK